MQKSYRIKTDIGTDKNIRLNINQDFDFLEILSLKLRQEDVYTRFCADYGVVAGRVITNGGYGLPNVNVSIFIPLESMDENDPVISTLYPYKRPDQKNEDGYRYNLLPYVKEYGGHTPTGTFPDREDILTRKEVLEVYEKYYKFTVKTNDSGDFMIIGVPLGMQTIIMDLDLSNIGCFSLRPSDMIRMGLGVASQFNGPMFKSSNDLSSLPQLINAQKDIDVASFWGEEDICNIGITRVDFDMRDYGIEIKPQAIFMGSIFSTSEEDFLKSNCKPKKTTGKLCDLVTAPAKILALRQTINYDVNGNPVLEQFNLPEGGNVIDDEGVWLTELPMNMDYVTTNEFGEEVISNDPKVGIPTKGKYRFRIQYQNEDGMQNDIMRADYLVPNVREYGWSPNPINGPSFFTPAQTDLQLKSYAFSLDWNDYADPQAAINCEDTFYEFNYNKVYTISNFLDRWKWGYNRDRHLGIKEITDRTCTSKINRFPVNDGSKNFDFLVFIFSITLIILTPIVYTLFILLHILALIWPILQFIINLIIWLVNTIVYGICVVVSWFSNSIECKKETIQPLEGNPFKKVPLPMLSFPDCETCPCEEATLPPSTQGVNQQTNQTVLDANQSFLLDLGSQDPWTPNFQGCYPFDQSVDDLSAYYNSTKKFVAGEDTPGIHYKVNYLESTSDSDPIMRKMGDGIALAQSMNLANIRPRYFDNAGLNSAQNKIKVIPNPAIASSSTNFYEDMCLVLLVDAGTKDNLIGKLLTFNNPDSIQDSNITGLTIANQFNTNTITGSTNLSPSGYDVPVTYIQDNGTQITRQIKLISTTNEKEYKYKTGLEYFQVVTGMTITEAQNTVGAKGLINKYLLKNKQWNSASPPSNNNSIVWYNDYANQEVLFLTRGVDPYTDKQTIQYDLSILFGRTIGDIIVEGEYHLNVPIQPNGGGTWAQDYRTPRKHNLVTNNTDTYLYHQPFNFNVDTSAFSSVTTTVPYYYVATDKSTMPLLHGGVAMSNWFSSPNNLDLNTSGGNTVRVRNSVVDYDLTSIGRVDGGSFTVSNHNLYQCYWVSYNPVTPPSFASQFETNNKRARVYSPAYHVMGTVTPITVTNNNRLVFRSDRLPTSDKTQTVGNNSYALHQNEKFGYYLPQEGGTTQTTIPPQLPGDTTNNSADSTDDGQTSVLESFNCENMTALGCYNDSNPNNFTVDDPCDDNPEGKRVKGGCYYFVDDPLLVSLPKDIKYYEEWKSRFLLMFAACRGVFSHVFNNNWVNGTLYMFSFKKKTIFSVLGQPKKYLFCGSVDSFIRPGQGPVVYTEGTTNSLFYRSSPYDGNYFVGQEPRKKNWLSAFSWTSVDYSSNDKNIFFPTTIMDLGSRDEFTKEICFSPNFEGYFIETVKSTSFQDTSDILQLFIISRLINSNFLGQLLGAGNASIDGLFSRDENKIDGDCAQAFSVNSEYGVFGFSEDEYDGANDIFVGKTGSNNPLFGIFFSSTTSNRILVTPGISTIGPNIYNTFGYPKTQEAPMYKWLTAEQNKIFGSEMNEWYTNYNSGNRLYSSKYQTLDFNTSDYFHQLNGPQVGFIFNYDNNGVATSTWPATQPSRFIVGAPFHFYFGLNKGKTAINRYITKYVLNNE